LIKCIGIWTASARGEIAPLVDQYRVMFFDAICVRSIRT
jgi:hypothetical protein